MACDKGYYCHKMGMNSQTECEAGHACPTVTQIQFACDPGYYSEARKTECTPCKTGYEGGFQVDIDKIVY